MTTRGFNINAGVPSMKRGNGLITVSDHQIISNYTVVPDNLTGAQFATLLAPSLFTRVGVLAQSYDLVRLESLNIRYIPMYGTSVPGMISMYIDYNDVAAPVGVPLAQSLLATGCVAGPIYRPLSLSWRPQDHGDAEYGSSSSNSTFRSDNKLTGIHIALQLPAVNPATYGLIVFDYTVSLKSLKATITGSQSNEAVISASLPLYAGHMSDTIQSLLSPK
jgi:hypothetical protein